MDTSDCYLKKHWARTCEILSAHGLYNFNRFSNEIMRVSVYWKFSNFGILEIESQKEDLKLNRIRKAKN